MGQMVRVTCITIERTNGAQQHAHTAECAAEDLHATAEHEGEDLARRCLAKYSFVTERADPTVCEARCRCGDHVCRATHRAPVETKYK